MSNIALKRCPILRTVLHRIILTCWTERRVPAIWKRGVTILIHKKGDTADPGNFRPITLQPCWYKIFSKVYATAIFDYLLKNKYVDTQLQKGFWRGIDGVTEHTEILDQILKTSNREKRSIVICLLDLKNAFGEVPHQLIEKTLKYHHLPSEIIDIFKDIYDDNSVCVSLNKSHTSPIAIGRGVLQGDPCSPLLFNICFNTLMQLLLQPQYRQLGFSYGAKGNHFQRSWLQFADDSVIISPNEASAQILINSFQAWSAWAGMTIRLDKCAVFGMKMQRSKMRQFSPALYLQQGQIPAIPPGGEFHYLGRRYGSDLHHTAIKKDLIEKVEALLKTTSELKIKPQTKIKILSQYIHGQLLFELRLYNFPLTWIALHLDAACTKHIRDWLELPLSACVKESVNIRKKEGGLGVDTIQHLSQKMQLLKRNTLRQSTSEDIRGIWSSSSSAPNNIATDDLLIHNKSAKNAVKVLKNNCQQKSLDHLLDLPLQGVVSKSILDNIKSSDIKIWGRSVELMAACIFNFSRQALLQILPTTAMLFRWNRSPDPFCTLCKKSIPQTNKHVLSNCGSVAALHRYSVRHDSILQLLVQWLTTSVPPESTVYADLPHSNTRPVRDLFQGVRPDIAIADSHHIHALELTVCHETNLVKSRDFKINRYKNLHLCGSTLAGSRIITSHFVEITTLGFISDLSIFAKLVKICPPSVQTMTGLTKCALDNSFQIYCNRNNDIIPISD